MTKNSSMHHHSCISLQKGIKRKHTQIKGPTHIPKRERNQDMLLVITQNNIIHYEANNTKNTFAQHIMAALSGYLGFT